MSPLPAGDDNPLTFDSIPDPVNINADVVRLWSRMMNDQPRSCIRFPSSGYNRADSQQRTGGMFGHGGIGPERICFNGNLPGKS